MWFKNLRVYAGAVPPRLGHPAGFVEGLQETMEGRPFTPCGKLEAHRAGFVPVIGGTYAHQANGCLFFKLRQQEKKVPAAAVAEEVARLIDKLGRPTASVGRKERQSLKEEATINLLPRAFPTDAYTLGFIHFASGRLFIDASSSSRAEAFMRHLRELLGALPCRPVEVVDSPTHEMTRWLGKGYAPDPFVLGAACALGHKDGREVKMREVSADSDGMRSQLAEGLVVEDLALEYAGRVKFTLTGGLHLRGLKFTDKVADEVDNHGELYSHDDELDARAFIMSHTLVSCFEHILAAFGGEAPAE